jgi:hypothetical protein
MTSPAYPVFEGDGGANAPKRPTAAVDLGGLDFVDSVKYPPKDRERLSASDYMQVTMSLERMARCMPVLVADLVLETAGGQETISVNSTHDGLTTVNVVTTEVSSGVYRVTYPTNMLPVPNGRPMASVVYSNGLVAVVDVPTYTSTTVDLHTMDFAGNTTSNGCRAKLFIY